MSNRHLPKRQQELSTLARRIGPSTGRANGENHVLATFVASGGDPSGESFGTHLAAATIEEDGYSGRPALLLVQPIQERILASKSLSLAAGERRAPLKVVLYGWLKVAFGPGAGTNVSQGD